MFKKKLRVEKALFLKCLQKHPFFKKKKFKTNSNFNSINLII